jgi:WD40 repeat protein
MQIQTLKKPLTLLVVLVIAAIALSLFDFSFAPHSKFSTSYTTLDLPEVDINKLPEKTVEVAGMISAFDISDDETMIALATSKGVSVYALDTLQMVATIPIENGAYGVAFSPDGTKLAILQKQFSSVEFGYVQVMLADTTNWQIFYSHQSGAEVYLYSISNQMKWNPDSIRLAFVTPDEGLVVWNTETEEFKQIMPDYFYPFGSFDWSPDGIRLIHNEANYGLRRWRVDTNDWVRLYDAESQTASVIAWSPNGKYIASGHFGGTVCVWNVGNNQCEGFIRAHFISVEGLAWSVDSSLIATSSGSIRIWDAKTGAEKNAFGYNEKINYTQTTWMTGKEVAALESSYLENISPTVKFWDIETGEVQVAFRGWREMKSVNYDGAALQIEDIQITDTDTLIQASLVFDYPNVSVPDWDVRLKDNTGKTYPITRIDDLISGNFPRTYRTVSLPKDKTYTLEIKSSNGLKLVRDVSNEYAFLYFDPAQLKLGESVELNQEIYLSEFPFYLTEAEKISENEIRFKFFTGYNLESVWFDNPLIVGNTVSVDGKGRFSSTLTFSKTPKDIFELTVQKVYYRVHGSWVVEFDVRDSMFVE